MSQRRPLALLTRHLLHLALLGLLLAIPQARAGWFGGLFGSSDPVLASMADYAYHASELNAYLDTLERGRRELLLHDRAALEQLLRSDTLRSYINARARAEHWHDNPKLAASFSSARLQGLYAAYLRALTEPPADYPGAQVVSDYYAAHQAEFTEPAALHLRQIYRVKGAGAEAHLNALKVQLDAEPNRFAELAMAESQHKASAAEGGDLGWLPVAQLIPEMVRALNGARPGALVGPVQSAQGWHLLQLVEARAQRTLPLDTVRVRIRANLLTEERARNEQALLQRLLKGHPVEVDEATLAKLFDNDDSGPQIASRMEGVSVTLAELRQQVVLLDEAQQHQLEQGGEALRQLVINYTIKRYLIERARAEGFDRREEVLPILDRAEADALYLSYLKSLSEPEAGYPTAELVARLYQEQKARLAVSERLLLDQIYLPRSHPDSAQLATQISQQLRAKPKRFAELARAHSAHQATAERGGEVGWVRRDQLLPEVAKALASQRPPAIIGPIETAQGWNIVRVRERKAGHERSLDELAPRLTELLRNRKREQNQQAYLQGLMQRYSVEIHQAELDRFLKEGD